MRSHTNSSGMADYRGNSDPSRLYSHENVILENPPAYDELEKVRTPGWYNVKAWSWKKKGVVFGSIIAIIIIIVVVAIVEVRKNRYPNYTALSYSMVDNIYGTNFFDSFDYFTGYDPTSGFVHYLQEDQMLAYAGYNLTTASSTTAIVKVDNKSTNQTTGRYSVRLTSRKAWDTGLFIFHVKHTPYGCGTWPALWLTNANLASWPNSGEIDVMEAVNNATTGNQMTLHTTDGCSMDVKRKETGSVLSTNCYNGTNDNAGCGIQGAASSYGAAFNANGGGVMAMELRSAGIRMWQFASSSVPADITAQVPNPSTWGEAIADFPNTNCDISNHFNNQSIVVDIDLCGTWAGKTSVYSGQDSCPGTCETYVAQNPSAFDNAYWEFGNFSIYQANGA